MTYKVRISKPEYSVYDAVQKQILDSDYPLLKLKLSGTGTLSKTGGSGSATAVINHGLGYVPQVIVYGYYLNEDTYPTATVVSRYKLFSFSDTPGLGVWDYYRYYADSNNLTINYSTTAYITPSVSLNYIYYIFYDPES